MQDQLDRHHLWLVFVVQVVQLLLRRAHSVEPHPDALLTACSNVRVGDLSLHASPYEYESLELIFDDADL
jgi:hypothetical protein